MTFFGLKRVTDHIGGWEWGGCSDNFQFGSQVARQFLDGQETGADSSSLVNLHNNGAGRVVSIQYLNNIICVNQYYPLL